MDDLVTDIDAVVTIDFLDFVDMNDVRTMDTQELQPLFTSQIASRIF